MAIFWFPFHVTSTHSFYLLHMATKIAHLFLCNTLISGRAKPCIPQKCLLNKFLPLNILLIWPAQRSDCRSSSRKKTRDIIVWKMGNRAAGVHHSITVKSASWKKTQQKYYLLLLTMFWWNRFIIIHEILIFTFWYKQYFNWKKCPYTKEGMLAGGRGKKCPYPLVPPRVFF